MLNSLLVSIKKDEFSDDADDEVEDIQFSNKEPTNLIRDVNDDQDLNVLNSIIDVS